MNGPQLTEDNFDDVARQAGDALRRPAPADGMTRIRTAQRRRQQARAAAGGTALAAIVALGAFGLTRGDDEPALVIQPDATAPATTVVPDETAPPTTTPASVPPTSAPTTVAPTTVTPATTPTTVPPVPALSAEAQAWIDARVAEGSSQIDLQPTDGTTARLLAATDPADGFPGGRVAVLLADGRVVEPPPSLSVRVATFSSVGDRPAFVEFAADWSPGTMWEVWVLDPTTTEWTSTGDLGLASITADWGGPTIRRVDDRLIVANNQYADRGDGTQVLSPNQAGVVVDADLTVTPMAPAPAGVAIFFTSASGGKALQMYAPAIEGGNSLDVSYDQPWQYDPVANEWSEIPFPDWFECSANCGWAIVPDVGAIRLEEPTARGVVALVPDGTVGLYDAATSTWTRMDDPPFTLAMPTTALVGDQLIVAPWRSGVDEFGTIGVLDVATGAWTTEQVDIPADIEARFDTEFFDVVWYLRVAGTRVMATPGSQLPSTAVAPISVYDTGTRTWSEPTDADLAAWRALDPDLGS